jgi:hypothetical protein
VGFFTLQGGKNMKLQLLDNESIIGIYALEQDQNGETRVEIKNTATGDSRWVKMPQGVGSEMLVQIVETAESRFAERLERERIAEEEARAKREAEQKAAEDIAPKAGKK